MPLSPVRNPSIGQLPQHQVKLFLWIIIAAATFLRIGYFFELQNNPVPVYMSQMPGFDQEHYVSLANNLIDTKFLGTQQSTQSPAYSYLIALLFYFFGPHLNAVFAFQFLFGLLAVYVFYRSAAILFENEAVGLICAFMGAVYSPLIFYEGANLRDLMTAYCLLLSFYFILKAVCSLRRRDFFIAGLINSFSMILRPQILPVFILLYISLGLKKSVKEKAVFCSFFILGFILIMIPLKIRNHLAGSKALIESSDSRVFWGSNSFDSSGFGVGGYSSPVQDQLYRESEGKIFKTAAVFIEQFALHPEEYFQLFKRKMKMLLNGYEIPANLNYALAKENSLMLKLSFLNFTALSPLALLGLLLIRKKFRFASLLYLYIIVLSFFIIMFHVQSRMRLQIVPFFIISASFSIFWLYDKVKSKSWAAAGTAFCVILLISCFTKPDRQIIQKYFGSPVRALDYINVANAYLHHYRLNIGRLTAAEKSTLLEKVRVNYNKATDLSRRRGKAPWVLPEILRNEIMFQ